MTINQISRASKMPEAGFSAWGFAPLPAGGGASSSARRRWWYLTKGSRRNSQPKVIAHMTNKENTAIMAQFFPPARKTVLEFDAFVNLNKLCASRPDEEPRRRRCQRQGSLSDQKSPQILAADGAEGRRAVEGTATPLMAFLPM